MDEGTTPQDLALRIERLESANRRTRLLEIGLALVIGVVLVIGGILLKGKPRSGPTSQTRTQKVIEAEEFLLKDKGGKTRGAWTVNPDGGAVLALNDRNESVCVGWTVHPDGETTLNLIHGGLVQAKWTLLPDGRTGVHLIDRNGRLRGAWVVLPDGRADLFLNDEGGKCRGAWTVNPDGTTGLSLFDEQGTLRCAIGSVTRGSREQGVAQTTSESSLALFDSNGKIIWQMPQE